MKAKKINDRVFLFLGVPVALAALAFLGLRVANANANAPDAGSTQAQDRVAAFNAHQGDLARRVQASADPVLAASVAQAMTECVAARLVGWPGSSAHQIEGACAQADLDRLAATHLDVEPQVHWRAMLGELGFVVPVDPSL